jgi:hypothetical protein
LLGMLDAEKKDDDEPEVSADLLITEKGSLT